MASKDQYMKIIIDGVAKLDTSSIMTGMNTVKKQMDKMSGTSPVVNSMNKQMDLVADKVAKIAEIKANPINEKSAKQAVALYDEVLTIISQMSKGLKNVDISKLSLNAKDAGYVALAAAVSDFDRKATKGLKTTESFRDTLVNMKSIKVGLNTDTIIQAIKDGKTFDQLLTEFDKKDPVVNLKLSTEEAKGNITALNDRLAELSNPENINKARSKNGAFYSNDAAKQDIQLLLDHYTAINKLKDGYEKFSNLAGKLDISGSTGLAQQLKDLDDKELREIIRLAEEARKALGQTGATGSTSFGEAEKDIEGALGSLKQLENTTKSLTNAFVNFFSIANGFRLLKTLFTNAFQVVSELDAAMTEIAVVTDMTLEQVWATRAGYSDLASDLGASTMDMINASKLYYQQGLDQARVTAAATETVKMARLANIDGTAATNLMTAAVRGFNMEMTDATMINDTYSWLAAKSAADTREIAEAMTKTASIANSAGASFQNTSAFLTQMIETTREAPENLGTALKTIVARFQELKKAPGEIGEIEGEYVDANKIETALKTIGIQLKNSTGQFRDFDDVIMEISSKWDSLDKMQQRYIATTAAGSRQQSRFIALVSNNARLLELTSGAANSAGASQEQFNKTLDSLEAKLNNLKNQLHIFYTSLVNSDIIKIGIDLLAKFLETINKIIGALPGGIGQIVALTTAVVGFLSATKIMSKVGSKLGESIASGLASSLPGIKPLLEKYFVKAAAGASTGFMTSFAAVGPLLLKIAGAAAALYLVFKGLKWLFEQFTLADDLERAKKATDEAKKAAQEAETAYNDLLNKKEAYNGLKETLDGLKVGTNEWKDALIKVNDEVLKLVQEFPVLLEYLDRSNTGVLSITEEGMDKLTSAAEAKVLGTQQKVYASKQVETDIGLKFTRETFVNSAKNQAGMNNDYEGNTKGVADNSLLSGELAKQIIAMDSTMAPVLESLKVYYFEDKQLLQMMTKYIQDYTTITQEQAANNFAMMTSAFKDFGNREAEFQSLVDSFAKETKSKTYDPKDFKLESFNQEGVKELTNDTLLQAKLVGATNMEEIYRALYGLSSTDTIPADLIADSNKMKEAILYMKDTLTKAMSVEDLYAMIGKDNAKKAADLISGTDASFVGDPEEYLKSIIGVGKEEMSAFLEAVGMEMAEFTELMNSRRKALLEDFAANRLELSNMAGNKEVTDSLWSTTKNLDMDLLNPFYESIIKQSKDQGPVFARTLISGLDDALKGQTDEDKEKIINAFSSVDFTSEESIAAFVGEMESIGVVLGDGILALLNKVAGAANSGEDILASVKGGAKLKNKMQAEGFNGIFSQEEYDELIKLGAQAGDFKTDLDGNYILIGQSLEALADMIDATAAAGIKKIQEGNIKDLAASDALRGIRTSEEAAATSGSVKNRLSELQAQGINTGDMFGSTATDINKDTSQEELDRLNQRMNDLVLKNETLRAEVESNKLGIEAMRVQAMSNTIEENLGKANDAGKRSQDSTDPAKQQLARQEEEAYNDALLVQAKTAGMAEDAILKYKEALETGSAETRQAARDSIELGKKFEKVREELQKLSKPLSELTEGTDEYNKALEAYTTRANEIFDVDLGSQFWKDAVNIDLANQAMSGNLSAYGNLMANMMASAIVSSDWATTYGINARTVETITTLLDSLKFDIDGTADFTPIFNELIALGMSVNQAKAAVESLAGTSVRFKLGQESIAMEFPTWSSFNVATPAWEKTKAVTVWKQSTTTKKVTLPTLTGVVSGKAINVKPPNISGGTGGGTGGGSPSGGGGGSGSGSEPEKWKSPYEWLYNITEDINGELRKRNKLELEFTDILEDRKKPLSELLANVEAQKASLLEQNRLNNELIAGHKTEATRLATEFSGVTQYASLDMNSLEIKIDYEALSKLTDPEKGGQVEEYISAITEVRDGILDAKDEILNTNELLEELKAIGGDEYNELEQRLKDAIVFARQKEIDELQAINESITSGNQRLIAGLQKGISDQRALRSKEKSLESIQDKESRLTLLQSDTSGASDLAIAQLQKELDAEKQSYTDTLIDTAISELTLGNDEAARQRENQISLMQRSLDQYIANGLIWSDVRNIMNGILTQGTLTLEAKALLESSELTKSMSFQGKKEWTDTLYEGVKSALLFANNNLKLSDASNADLVGKSISFMDKSGKTLTGTVGKDGKVTTSDGTSYTDLFRGADGTWQTTKNAIAPPAPTTAPATTPTPTTTTSTGAAATSTLPYTNYTVVSGDTTSGLAARFLSDGNRYREILDANGKALADYNKIYVGQVLRIPVPSKTAATVAASPSGYKDYTVQSGDSAWGIAQAQLKDGNRYREILDANMKSLSNYNLIWPGQKLKIPAYKEGGKIDFTGLMWADGSKTKPESMLSANDTKNFIQLKDFLQDVSLGKNNSAQEIINYDIDIHVDEVADLEDIDGLTERITKNLVDKAQHRNVNALGFGRRG